MLTKLERLRNRALYYFFVRTKANNMKAIFSVVNIN